MKRLHPNKLSSQQKQKLFKVLAVVFTVVLACAVFTVPAFAATINTNMTTDKLVGGIISFVCKAAMYIGFVIAASGIFMFIMAYKDDNAESQSRGARMAVVGALLIGLESLLKLTGLIT